VDHHPVPWLDVVIGDGHQDHLFASARALHGLVLDDGAPVAVHLDYLHYRS